MNINEIELARNLATDSTHDELLINPNIEDSLYEFDENDKETTIWKPFAQEVFNRWYDYYLSEINKCKI